MKLTRSGDTIIWTAMATLAMGLLLLNPMILFAATLLLLSLLYEAITFRLLVERTKESTRLENHPARLEAKIGQSFKIETVLESRPSLSSRIVGVFLDPPSQIVREQTPIPELSKSPSGHVSVETGFIAKTPGKFEITVTTVALESRLRLFTHLLKFPVKIAVLAKPMANAPSNYVETDPFSDLAIGVVKGDSGVELAGVRPATMIHDLHRIDWKATARTGRLMTREFFLEKEPTIMLLVEASPSMKTAAGGSSIFNSLLAEFENILATIRLLNPIGLVLYDEASVLTYIEARPGAENREKFIQAVLDEAHPTTVKAPVRRLTSSYAYLTREARALESELAGPSRTRSYRNRFDNFARTILPFYQERRTLYSRRLGQEGVFKAFEIVCRLPDPILVIAISDGITNLDGLFQGAKIAAISKHRILVVLLTPADRAGGSETFSDLEDLGVRILQCTAKELPRRLRNEILAMSHARVTPIT